MITYLNKILFLIVLGILILPQVGFCGDYSCQCTNSASSFSVDSCSDCNSMCGGASNVSKCRLANSQSSGSGIPNPLNTGKEAPISWQSVIGMIIQGILGVVGSLALLMFVYGGFTWMTAGGGNEAIQKGKNIIMWATVGLIIIFSSYALVRMVFSGLGV